MTLDLDPDRRLALAYVPARFRPTIGALWRLDVTFGSILSAGRDPMVSRLRLAWWRESLERLDREGAPAEPLLQALAASVLPAGVSGAELASMAGGWEILLTGQTLSPQDLVDYARLRGGLLFQYSAHLLGCPDYHIGQAGKTWALVDLARHTSRVEEAEAALGAVDQNANEKWPLTLRPLGMLAMLATRDVSRRQKTWEASGSAARMLRMLRHRLTGY